ncbi:MULTISPECIES: CdaR family transcriptional regulator [unclassified Rhodococcus (in: high G+C Gram-positive bacteria)]|uniref:PucR family transcriptional regulator n=1 Tax=unclassified Rhodococcus (in: high G+C Gram-positive bacteria) TaxID=192944 RepID=UPI0016398D09|nr:MULTISPECIES: helix-turn-helix domain-containing protein [unclassified Rhodococcus (in: high G+C Gram-positive bacteria)]MBC2638191.1 helix-turn-helix domain-containing protein [Rhodococcus sp. 3A]MBC2897066.1 helix-turn-helix domain-containing protein [Rhodococcus sp. 4CII]
MSTAMSVGKEVQAMVESLADQLGRSVVIVDPSIRPLYISRHFGDEDPARVRSMLQRGPSTEVRDHILAQGVARWHEPRTIEGDDALGLKSRLCVPLHGPGWLLGLMMVIDADQSLTPSEIDHMARVSRDVAAQIYSDSLAADPQQFERRRALRNLLGSEVTDRQSALQHFGEHREWHDAEHSTVVVMQVSASAQTIMPIEVALQIAVETVCRGSQPCAYYLDSNHATLLHLTDQPLRTAELRERVERVKADLQRLLGAGATVTIGIGSGAGGRSNAWHTRHRATIALRAATRLSRFHDGIAFWNELGVDAVLLELPDDALTWSVLPTPVRALVDHDTSGKLIETLRAYLNHGGSVSRTATALHLHRTSLYYRLDQIRSLTELDLEDGGDRLLLHVGLHLLDMLGRPDH